jgi:hypothetical protein
MTVSRWSNVWTVAVLAGCAAAAPAPRTSSAYPGGRCELLELEQVEQPSDQPADHVSIVARYRFGDSARGSERVSLSFRVLRERADDLSAHIAAHPSVLCKPEGQRGYDVELPPFDGKRPVAVEAPQR